MSAFGNFSFEDYNSDGRDDLLWYNSSSRDLSTWLMNGTTFTPGGIGGVPVNWAVQGAGDFDGNGQGDVLLRNFGTGQVAEWYTNGTSLQGGGVIATVAG